jgi:excisionase family DNA binding protein
MFFWSVNPITYGKEPLVKGTVDDITSVSELAQYLGCSPSTIYTLLQRSKLPASNLDWDLRLLIKPVIDRWVQQSRRRSKPGQPPKRQGRFRSKSGQS